LGRPQLTTIGRFIFPPELLSTIEHFRNRQNGWEYSDKFEVEQFALQDACWIKHPVCTDDRKRFSATSHQSKSAAHSLQTDWVQEDESFSRDASAYALSALSIRHSNSTS